MSQDQTANIFGFISTENNPNGLQKTAKFFNPSEKGSETSFLTQTTDRTDNTSSQTASEQQIIKGDIRRKPYNGKRVLSAHVNNRKKECELPQLMSPSLVTLKSAPPVEQIPPEYRQRPLLRNCISQESMRRRIDEPKEIINFGVNMANMPENNFGGLPKRSAFFSNNGQNLVYVSDSELYAEKENCQENGDFIMNQGFRIRTHSNGGKVKIEKFNKIKVISAIPQADNLNGSLKASVLLKRGFSDKKVLKIDTKKSSLEIDLDEPKMALRQHPQSSHAISPNVFVFPNSATSKPRGISPVLLQNIEVIRSNTPSSASLRRAPLLLNKCDDHEPLKGLMDIRSPPVQDNDKLSMKRVQSERGKQISIGKNLEIGGAGSPIVRVGSHMSFKRSAFAAESSALSPTGPLDLRLKIQRGNSKFKNEEAVLNKLFNPVSLRKKE